MSIPHTGLFKVHFKGTDTTAIYDGSKWASSDPDYARVLNMKSELHSKHHQPLADVAAKCLEGFPSYAILENRQDAWTEDDSLPEGATD